MIHVVKHFAENQQGRDFVCGDLHGCYDVLMARLEQLGFDFQKDRMFSVGDLIDRGPMSWRCLQLIEEPWFFANRGNHEEMMLEELTDAEVTRRVRSWRMNNSDWHHYHVKEHGAIPAEFLAKVAALPLISCVKVRGETVNIVHAQFPERLDGITQQDVESGAFERYDLNALLWGRERVQTYRPVWAPEYAQRDQHLNRTYVGHTPLKAPLVIGKLHYIDTGCVFDDGSLTIVEL